MQEKQLLNHIIEKLEEIEAYCRIMEYDGVALQLREIIRQTTKLCKKER